MQEVTELKDLDFTKREVREQFIRCNASNIYVGKNVDDEEVIVMLDQGKGMLVKTIHKEKPMWYEVVEYDNLGISQGVTYEPVNINN